MEELAVGARPHLVDDGRLEVDCTGYVLSCAHLLEEGVERVVAAADGLVARHLTVGLDAVLEAVLLSNVVAVLESTSV